MSDETTTTQVQRRRVSDAESKQRIVTGWVGIILAAVICLTGLYRGNDAMVLAAFIGAMVAGNRIPYTAVEKFIPWGRKE